AFAEDAGIDANQLASDVDERASRIAGIDRRVRLHEIFVVRESQLGPPRCAHDSGSDRLAQLKRAADREHPFADFQLAGVSPGHHRQASHSNFQERNVSRWIRADDLALDFTLVWKSDGDFTDVLADDMIVGDDEAVGRDHHTRAEAERTSIAGAKEIVLA